MNEKLVDAYDSFFPAVPEGELTARCPNCDCRTSVLFWIDGRRYCKRCEEEAIPDQPQPKYGYTACPSCKQQLHKKVHHGWHLSNAGGRLRWRYMLVLCDFCASLPTRETHDITT